MPALDFLVAGQGKSGTTTIYELLKRHPDVFVPGNKENAFFAQESFHYGFPYYELHYQSDYKGELMVGDCFSANLMSPAVPKRLFETFGPKLKFVFLLRHPFDRAVSHYMMAVRQLRETLPFHEATLEEANRYALHPVFQTGFSYLGRGRYFAQINQYLNYFEKDNMMFVIFEEEIKQNLDDTFKNICDFLGVANHKIKKKHQRKNVAPSNLGIKIQDTGVSLLGQTILKPTEELVDRVKNLPALLESAKDFDFEEGLYRFWFKDDVEQLEKLIDRDLSVWYSRYEFSEVVPNRWTAWRRLLGGMP